MNLNSIIRNIKWRYAKLFYNEEEKLWQKLLFINEDFKNGKIIPLNEYTKHKQTRRQEQKRVVCIYDNKLNSGGLADRIKGIMSMYQLCKELDIDFKILFTSPFKLTSFLIPNKVNWCIESNELNYNTQTTDICYIYSIAGTIKEADNQRTWFNRWLKSNKREFHVRTNARIFDNKLFADNFNELFTIAPRLQKSIDTIKEELEDNYISTSFRFLNLLGDFNETTGAKAELSLEEKKELIEKNLTQLQKLHSSYPGKRILVNSDSKTFLQEAAKIHFTYTIPGNITHIDDKNISCEYETYEKTFLDFFMIANAEKIFLLKSGGMYKSGYPGIASLINNRPFEIIEF